MATISPPSAVRLGASQNLTSPGATAAFGTGTFMIRVVAATAAVNIKIGNGLASAAATDTLIPPNVEYYFIVSPGQNLASIGAGTVNITEC